MMTDDDTELLMAMEAEFDDSDQPQGYIDDDMMQRRMAWNISPDRLAHEVMRRLDLPTVSDDVEQMEMEESYARLTAVNPIVEPIMALALKATRAAREATLVENDDDPHTSEMLDEDHIGPVIFSCTVAILAELMDLDLIHVAHYEDDED